MNAGTCRRIKFTPLPFGLSLVTTGFIMLWLVLLPFGLTNATAANSGFSLGTAILSTWTSGLGLFILSAMLLCVDEAANQLEDPFHSLPLFDATKTAMAHLSMVPDDFAKLRAAAG
jgi:putative membrane protein